MKYLVHQVLRKFNRSWWLEISTTSPEATSSPEASPSPEASSSRALSSDCDYYFGPFASKNEALQNQPGFIEDIEQEGSQVSHITVVRRTTPQQLTIEYSKAA